MSASDPQIIRDLFKFRRFRLNVLTFLRLPLDTHEQALRDAMESSSASLLADYLQRADQARSSVVRRVNGESTVRSEGSDEDLDSNDTSPDALGREGLSGAAPRTPRDSATLAFNQITQRIHRRPVVQRSNAVAV